MISLAVSSASLKFKYNGVSLEHIFSNILYCVFTFISPEVSGPIDNAPQGCLASSSFSSTPSKPAGGTAFHVR